MTTQYQIVPLYRMHRIFHQLSIFLYRTYTPLVISSTYKILIYTFKYLYLCGTCGTMYGRQQQKVYQIQNRVPHHLAAVPHHLVQVVLLNHIIWYKIESGTRGSVPCLMSKTGKNVNSGDSYYYPRPFRWVGSC